MELRLQRLWARLAFESLAGWTCRLSDTESCGAVRGGRVVIQDEDEDQSIDTSGTQGILSTK